MSNPEAVYEARYDAFIEAIQQTGVVWGLCTEEDDWAVCASSEFEDTDVMPFWSDEAAAKAQCVGDWAIFRAEPVPMEEFIEDWLPGMNEDGMLLGPNWTENLEGLEVEPYELAERLGVEYVDEEEA